MEYKHIEFITLNVIKFCGIFYKLKCLMPPAVLKSVYFSLVHPHFIYGIEIYANTYSKYVDPLIKINNKILKIIQNRDLKTSINQLYINYNTLPIPKLHDLHILLFMHRYNYDKKIPSPSCFTIISN